MSYNIISINSFKSQADADLHEKNKPLSERIKDVSDKHSKAIIQSLKYCEKFNDKLLTDIINGLMNMELDPNKPKTTDKKIIDTTKNIIYSHLGGNQDKYKSYIEITCDSNVSANYFKLHGLSIYVIDDNSFNSRKKMIQLDISSSGNIIDKFIGVAYFNANRESIIIEVKMIDFIKDHVQNIITQAVNKEKRREKASKIIINLAKKYNGDKKDFIKLLKEVSSVINHLEDKNLYYHSHDQIAEDTNNEINNIFDSKQNKKEGE